MTKSFAVCVCWLLPLVGAEKALVKDQACDTFLLVQQVHCCCFCFVFPVLCILSHFCDSGRSVLARKLLLGELGGRHWRGLSPAEPENSLATTHRRRVQVRPKTPGCARGAGTMPLEGLGGRAYAFGNEPLWKNFVLRLSVLPRAQPTTT